MAFQDLLAERVVTLYPEIRVGRAAARLAKAADDRITRVVVDCQALVPDMFEISFSDPDAQVLNAGGFVVGTPVEVWANDSDGTKSRKIVSGEVTALEGTFIEYTAQTVVRGYTLDHRMQRYARTRTFIDQKDSEIASTLAREAGLKLGTIDTTPGTVHYVVQANQTDWQFLSQRAREIGYELGVADSTFYFRKPSLVGDGTPIPLAFRDGLLRFTPRLTAGNLAPEAEVRVWDPIQATVIAARSDIGPDPAVPADSRRAGTTAKTFSATASAPAGSGGPQPGGDLGPPPSTHATVVTNLPLPAPGGSDAAPGHTARAVAGRLADTFAEAEGECLGDARIGVGAVLQVAGVSATFSGRWLVTSARHIFDAETTGYRTRFTAGGARDRSLLALSGASGGTGAARLSGVACGIVTNVNDPEKLGRVKVSLPWLAPTHESDWAPVGQLFAGTADGALFLPSPGDQILVAFEFGDVRRPYVVASLTSAHTRYGVDGSSTKPGAAGVQATGEAGAVVRRGLISPGGNMRVFHDEVPPNGKGKPLAAEVTLASKDQKVGLSMDQVNGTVTLRCSPDLPGKLVIESSGSIELKAGAEGTLTIDGGTRLSLKGKTVEINGTGPVAVKGKPIQLN